MRLACKMYDRAVNSLWPKHDAIQTHIHVMVSRLHNATVSSNTTFPHRQKRKKTTLWRIHQIGNNDAFIDFRKETLAVVVIEKETEIQTDDDLNQELFNRKSKVFCPDHLNDVSLKVSFRFRCAQWMILFFLIYRRANFDCEVNRMDWKIVKCLAWNEELW